MTDSRSYKEKYYKLKEKFENLNKQKEDLKHSLEVNKHRSRRLKEENNSSSSDELLSDATSEDVEDVPMQATNKYEQPKQTLTKESKRKVTSPSSSSARKTTTTRPSPPQPSTASFSSTKSSGKRKAEESVPVEEAQTQKRRRKPTTVKKKRDDRTDAKRIEPLPMNPDDTLKLPVTIGEIVWDREAYHTNRYIFPVGFMSKKQYLSAVDVTRRTTYTSEILDGGDTPIFQITAEDQPGRKFSASSSSGVWKKILDEINVQGVPSKTHASGPEMLGLSHLGITKYIQELPGAEKCTKYVMQRWVDDDDDHENENNDVDNFSKISNKVSKSTNGYH
ncbi:16643_t:CDS:10 [Entrophospora sp. SA101]|nr:10819_t:CDS:10 [Entrophospora sp. SA101]CAJ0750928.1 16643_t:CDS:10 [Entrophospora sp. SA101]CAJ0831285.1 1281_t:CDS:10 [Entrophospora sp. SA101]